MRLMVADSNRAIHYGLRAALRGQADVVVVGEAQDGRTAISLAHELRPEILILELTLAGLGGLDVIRALAPMLPEVRILVFSNEIRWRADAFAAGAAAFVTKDSPEDELVQEIRRLGSSRPAPAMTLLGESLVTRGLITTAQLEAAIAWQRELRHRGRDVRLGELLREIGAVAEGDLEKALQAGEQAPA